MFAVFAFVRINYCKYWDTKFHGHLFLETMTHSSVALGSPCCARCFSCLSQVSPRLTFARLPSPFISGRFVFPSHLFLLVCYIIRGIWHGIQKRIIRLVIGHSKLDGSGVHKIRKLDASCASESWPAACSGGQRPQS